MTEIKDKVKQEIKLSILKRIAAEDWILEDIVNSILSIRKIAIVDRKALLSSDTHISAQQVCDLYEAGWVKEIKDELET